MCATSAFPQGLCLYPRDARIATTCMQQCGHRKRDPQQHMQPTSAQTFTLPATRMGKVMSSVWYVVHRKARTSMLLDNSMQLTSRSHTLSPLISSLLLRCRPGAVPGACSTKLMRLLQHHTHGPIHVHAARTCCGPARLCARGPSWRTRGQFKHTCKRVGRRGERSSYRLLQRQTKLSCSRTAQSQCYGPQGLVCGCIANVRQEQPTRWNPSS